MISPDRGPAAKTCSPECQRDRNNAREKVRYARVKGTVAWQATRADYIERLKARKAADPDFAERLAAKHRAAVAKFRATMLTDPERLAVYREKKRQWHRDLSPEKKAARKYWYGGLSPELKRLFLLELREQRALARLNALKREGW